VKIYIIFILFYQILNAYVDFGVVGPLYSIEEENGDDLIQRKIKDINVTQLQQDIEEEIDKLYYSKLSLQHSYIDKEITKKDIVLSRYDIQDLYGNIVLKKGEEIVSKIPKGTSFSLCFIDASLHDDIVKKIISDFGKNCIYLINNADSRIVGKKYNITAYPMGGQNLLYIDRFNISQLPIKITKNGAYITRKQLNIKRLIGESKNF